MLVTLHLVSLSLIPDVSMGPKPGKKKEKEKDYIIFDLI